MRKSIYSVGLVISCVLSCSIASALPFNTDMFEVQPSTDAVARQKPAGSVAVGSLERQKPDLTTPWAQKNPFEGDLASVARGERKFQTNCAVCHGEFVGGLHRPSDLQAKGMVSLDLSAEATRVKPDVHYFNYVFNGGVVMPAYGYKLSNNEIWDMISYVRAIQQKLNVGQVKDSEVKK